MRKITLPSGTMLPSNASNHVDTVHLNADSDQQRRHDEGDEDQPVGHAEDLHADLGARAYPGT